VVRVAANDIEHTGFVLVGDGIVVPHVVACRNVVDARDRGFYFLVVRIDKFDGSAGLQTPVGQTGLSLMDPDAVGGNALEFAAYAVFNTCSRAQQQNEHEDTPGHAETGEKSSQPVGTDGGEDFLEKV